MPFDWLVPALLAVLIVLTLRIALRRPPVDAGLERHGRELREDVLRSAQATRQELATTLALFQQTLLTQQGDFARTQNEQIDSFSRQLAATQQHLAESQNAQGARQASSLKDLSESLALQLQALVRANDLRMSEVKATVETRLNAIQADNEKKLEQIRATVDEKLHATLEQRLGESFKHVAERLEQVHSGLGEMKLLAKDVGSLSRVLGNVKTRGILGEVQLSALLDQVFTMDQYATNVETVPGTGARVEFAIKLPGRREDGVPLWLPIDCKFPRDDYERLLEAQDAADKAGIELAGRAIEQRLRLEARAIRTKYIAPPHTTDFGIMFLPTEGLYAEAIRRPGLIEVMQREHRVVVTGPTTLLATLTSLQMGFRTLALEKRTSEVWEVLGAVKTKFGEFGDALAKTKKKLAEASNTIEAAERSSRGVSKSLREVEVVSDDRAQALLPGGLFDEDEPPRDA